MSGIRQDLEEIKKIVERTEQKVQRIEEYLSGFSEEGPG